MKGTLTGSLYPPRLDAREPSSPASYATLGTAETASWQARAATPARVAVTLVVPCYNEGARLDPKALLPLTAGDEAVDLLFVDDGSRDDTGLRLLELQAERPNRVDVLTLPTNCGKAEAVRQGMLRGLDAGAALVGYFDADLATPPSEIARLVRIMRRGQMNALLAARVAMLGRAIDRRAVRHYLGRVFASGASVVLGLDVYDTQCGAKLFRRHPALAAALAEPFLSRWAFDVELLGRLLIGGDGAVPVDMATVVEEPLLEWRDVSGSKVRARQMAGAAWDILRIAHDLRRRAREP